MPKPPLSFAKFRNMLRARDGRSVSPPSPSMPLFATEMLDGGDRVANESVIRASCNVAYLGNNTALCRILGRYKAYVDTTDIALSSHLMLDGYWEMWVTETLASLIRPGMVVADVGANIGYFTLLMAELVGPSGRVHAFEPNPRLVELLDKSLLVNGFARWATVHQTALGDRGDHSVRLVIPPGKPMNAYILPLDADAPCESVEVPVARLDSREDWQAIELAKIDVEGAEELIWVGAQGLLDSGTLRTVILEFNPLRYENARAFLERLSMHGFAIQHLTLDAGVVPTDMDSILCGSGTEDTMLVLKR